MPWQWLAKFEVLHDARFRQHFQNTEAIFKTIRKMIYIGALAFITSAARFLSCATHRDMIDIIGIVCGSSSKRGVHIVGFTRSCAISTHHQMPRPQCAHSSIDAESIRWTARSSTNRCRTPCRGTARSACAY